MKERKLDMRFMNIDCTFWQYLMLLLGHTGHVDSSILSYKKCCSCSCFLTSHIFCIAWDHDSILMNSFFSSSLEPKQWRARVQCREKDWGSISWNESQDASILFYSPPDLLHIKILKEIKIIARRLLFYF